eukprot:Clim_evm14s236 gene=Clim_evmTU14s236
MARRFKFSPTRFWADIRWLYEWIHTMFHKENIINRTMWLVLTMAVLAPVAPVIFVWALVLSPILFLIAGFILMMRIHDAPRFRSAPHRRIEGYCAPEWQPVRDQFASAITSGNDLGASVCVYHEGEQVVDLAGGAKGAGKDKGFYDRDTVNCVYSSTKFVESLVIAMLVDRGHLEYDKPIAEYWPEFATNGKQLIEVQELMRHAAGLSALDRVLELNELWPENMDKFGEYLARVKPIYKKRPGRKMPTAYHGFTRGFYINQIVRRVDPKGRNVRQFILEEITGPLGIDLFVGLHPEDDAEIVERRKSRMTLQPKSVVFFSILPQLFLPSRWYLPFINNPYHKVPRNVKRICASSISTQNDTQTARALLGVVKSSPADMNGPDWLRGLSSSTNGYSNARALAKITGVLANGGSMDGVTLLSPEGLKKALETDGRQLCRVIHTEVEFTRCGWAYFEEELNGCYGWGGYGGSMVLFQPDLKFSYSYVMNAIGTAALGDYRGISCLDHAMHIADEKEKAVEDKRDLMTRRISVKNIKF